MTSHVQKTAQFGDLVAAVFDQAMLYSGDPREVSLMATQAVEHILRGARRFPVALPRHASKGE
jgi:hypothetical protein